MAQRTVAPLRRNALRSASPPPSRGHAYCALSPCVSPAPVNRSRPRGSGLLDRAPEFLVALLGDAHLYSVRRRAVSHDGPVRPRSWRRTDVGVQIVAVGLVLHAAADVGPMPGASRRQAGRRRADGRRTGGEPRRSGRARPRARLRPIALAILPGLEQAALFGKERMLLDVGDANVVPFSGGCIISSNGSPPVSMARSMASPAACRNCAFLSVLRSIMLSGVMRFACCPYIAASARATSRNGPTRCRAS